jgi:thiol oxidase
VYIWNSASYLAAHPLRACKRGAQELVDTFAVVWPDVPGADLARVRRTLAGFRVCGDGHPAPMTWRACRGSEEGKRGYTCGLWLLFHSLAARAAYPTSRDGGLRWLQATAHWVKYVCALSV